MEKDAFTIPEFCTRHGLSRSLLYKQWASGEGPERMLVGDKVLISFEAAARWRAACEQRAREAPPPRLRGRQAKVA